MNILEIAKYNGAGVIGNNEEPIEVIFYKGTTQLEAFAKEITEQSRAEFKYVLEQAQNGLKWYQDAHPEYASNVDDELHSNINALLIGSDVQTTSLEKIKGVQACLTKISEFCPADNSVDLMDDSNENSSRLTLAEVGDTARSALYILNTLNVFQNIKFEYDELTEEYTALLDSNTGIAISGGNRKNWARYFNTNKREGEGNGIHGK